MAIDRTGISSLNAGAGEITYSGNEGPKSPQQMAEFELMEYMEEFEKVFPEMKPLRGTEGYMQSLNEYFRGLTKQESREGIQMASAEDPILKDEYDRYVFELKEIRPEATPMTIEEFRQQAISGMAYGGTAKPTYTQSRKQRMAYGGIAGLDGRKKYGAGSWFQENIMDPIKKVIPNEIKDNPVLSAAVAGGLLNQFGIPGLPGNVAGENMGQNWLGELLSKVPGTGEETIDMVLGGDRRADQIGLGQGISNIFNTITGQDTELSKAEKQAQVLAQGTSQGDYDIYGNKIIEKGAEALGLKGVYDKFTNFMGPNEQGVNWQTPLAIGTAMGAAQAAMPKDVLPQDTSGINIPAIREAALRGEGGAFLPRPEATTAYAQGGRIGFKNGSSDYKDFLKDKEDGIISPDTTFNEWLDNNAPDPDYDKVYADGGRIGYSSGSGGGGDPIAEIVALLSKRMLGGLTTEETSRLDELIKDTGFMEQKAQGGRIGAQEGGLMDLGGMEKDYREEGGFVPIGGQERADDVPARLSKNEFVFTADAVRAAGGGDIDAGAEVMENLMNNLEQGGQVSEESQGLEGARNMFATAQRLEGVM